MSSQRPRGVSMLVGLMLTALLHTPAVAAQHESGDAALAREVAGARVTLARGLSAASAHGKPISGKYEMENGKLQLSVYTEKAGHFREVIVNHVTGRIAKSEEIKDGDDLNAAKAQSEAMAKAARSLGSAVARAQRANPGYRAVAATGAMEKGHPVATVRLMRGATAKSVQERLD